MTNHHLQIEMKYFLKISLTAIASSALLSGCGGDDAPAIPNTPSLNASRISGDIGQGYDSITRSIKPTYCIRPPQGEEWKEVGSSSATLSMSLESDRTKIARSIGVDVEASYSVVSASASFYRETETDDFSAAYIFGGAISFKERQVGPDYIVNPQLAGFDPVDWREYCGDSFVQKVARGASLYSAMKFRFKSRDEKQSFEAKMKASGGLYSVSAALKTAQSFSNQSISVSVSAVQVGGDVTQLNRILNGGSAASCALSDVKKCLEFVDSIESYVSNDFPKQFRDSNGVLLSGSTLENMISTVDYDVRPWTDIPIPGQPNFRNRPLAKQLLDAYASQFSLLSKIEKIRAIPILGNRSASMADKQNKTLSSEEARVRSNIAKINNAWETCYPVEKTDCMNAVANTLKNQEEISSENIVPWFDMVAYNQVYGLPAHENDLIDINNDGYLDLCYVTSDRFVQTPMECVMGVGGGFEERPGRSIYYDARRYGLNYGSWRKIEGSMAGLYYCHFEANIISLSCDRYFEGAFSEEKSFILSLYNYPDGRTDPVTQEYHYGQNKVYGYLDFGKTKIVNTDELSILIGQNPYDFVSTAVLQERRRDPGLSMYWFSAPGNPPLR